MPIERPDGWQASVTATWGLGGTVGVAHDDEYTSITIGPAEGTGFFGSAGEGKAAHQSTSGTSAKLGLGFVSGELSVDGTGITGKGNLNMPINPGINQTVVSYTGKINPDFSSRATRPRRCRFGMQDGLATTQTVTIAIPNSAFETVANWLGGSRLPARDGRRLAPSATPTAAATAADAMLSTTGSAPASTSTARSTARPRRAASTARSASCSATRSAAATRA